MFECSIKSLHHILNGIRTWKLLDLIFIYTPFLSFCSQKSMQQLIKVRRHWDENQKRENKATPET
jgi:hypothetical protein